MGHKLDKRVIGVMLLVAVVVVILLLRSCNGSISTYPADSKPPQSTLDFTPVGEQQGNPIIIPGMTGINLKSGQLQQSVDFHNPQENACYFVLSLYLSDDTLIYQ